jgi:hypothetical protein
MTMTSSNKVLAESGAYHVRIVRVKDERVPDEGASNAFGIFHTETDVMHGSTHMLSVAIRGCYALDKDLQSAKDDPLGEKEEAPRGGFGGGFPSFG